MNYKFMAIGDIHWGAMDNKLMYNNLQFVTQFIRDLKDQVDLVVLCGDYFDYRIQLSSKTAILAVKWFDELIEACKYANVKKVRVIRGTKDHDNDQLEVFRPSYETNDGFVKIFNTSTIEETLPGMKVYYGPDENVNLVDYHKMYLDLLLEYPDIGFFHGNFDVVLPSIEYDRIQNNNIPTMIYEYNKFASFIKGPLISAHWHNRVKHDALYYIGSFDRWKFGEEEDKGFIYGNYDTEDSTYQIHRINNPNTLAYTTLTYINSETFTPLHFAEILDDVELLESKYPGGKIRIIYMIVEDSVEGVDINLSLLQKTIANKQNVKIEIKDLIKKAIKKKRKDAVLFNASKYGYIFEDPKNISGNITKYIQDKKGVSVDEKLIDKYVKRYL